ncbi:MAG: polymerase sigma-70 factor, subfamily [Myxococcales bacterium]|jgi:DNA-directed RNA polymerase specialized sigma24 family protein|nr:polymerase sigma-70 factor, subfamily [Myxococcales bacterium]
MLRVAYATPATELDAPTVRRAVRGDADASRVLVELYQGRVFAMVSRMLAGRGRATIEDTAQDTFLQVFRQLARFDVAGRARLSTRTSRRWPRMRRTVGSSRPRSRRTTQR